MGLPLDTYVLLAAVGAGTLAFWAFERFPRLGGSSLRAALCNVAASMLLVQLALALVPDAVGFSRALLPVWLVGLMVAPLGYFILSSLWTVRALADPVLHRAS